METSVLHSNQESVRLQRIELRAESGRARELRAEAHRRRGRKRGRVRHDRRGACDLPEIVAQLLRREPLVVAGARGLPFAPVTVASDDVVELRVRGLRKPRALHLARLRVVHRDELLRFRDRRQVDSGGSAFSDDGNGLIRNERKSRNGEKRDADNMANSFHAVDYTTSHCRRHLQISQNLFHFPQVPVDSAERLVVEYC